MKNDNQEELECYASGGVWNTSNQSCVRPGLNVKVLHQGPCQGKLVVRVFRQSVINPALEMPVGPADFKLLQGPLMKAMKAGKAAMGKRMQSTLKRMQRKAAPARGRSKKSAATKKARKKK